jgi:hypothetical protein
MNILFLVTSKTSLKVTSQKFFSGSSVRWGAGLILCVCCEEGVRIGQGLNTLFNPLSMNYNNVQLFILLDHGKGALIL